ncbi:hypothetical protein JHW43_001195 [Diplocarpon mali]|nr:hypothetical protein JHW43_001195 [Diplocarpon mali]
MASSQMPRCDSNTPDPIASPTSSSPTNRLRPPSPICLSELSRVVARQSASSGRTTLYLTLPYLPRMCDRPVQHSISLPSVSFVPELKSETVQLASHRMETPRREAGGLGMIREPPQQLGSILGSWLHLPTVGNICASNLPVERASPEPVLSQSSLRPRALIRLRKPQRTWILTTGPG